MVLESRKRPLIFQIHKKCSTTRARSSQMILPHFTVPTPHFMPVGTSGCIKGLTTQQLVELECHIILANTYHMALRPGKQLLQKVGGLHKFMNWNRAMLTDSGGFQMVSLLQLSLVTEQGVSFVSPFDPETTTLLTPEDSISVQNAIGADIIMQLDDVVATTLTGPRVEEAMWRSIRWLDRCIAAHDQQDTQSLFPIIQGGLDVKLREICLEEMIKRDADGYAIGGLSGGESKDQFWRIVSKCTDALPSDRPRYCMGVGYAEDLVVCSALGVDMYDCVFPTRTARFGNALTRKGPLKLKNTVFEHEHIPIEKDCPCPTCKTYTRSFLSRLVRQKETVGCHLISMHNIAYQMKLMRDIRGAIDKDVFPHWIQQFMKTYYHSGQPCNEENSDTSEQPMNQDGYPVWIANALESVGVQLLSR